MRTIDDGFSLTLPDRVRDPELSEAEVAALAKQEEEAFEEGLLAKVISKLKDRKKKGQVDKTAIEIEADLRDARERRKAKPKKLTPARSFVTWVRETIVEGMKSTIQAMFYACDYSTKPNMTCAPLLVAVRDGIGRLEEQFRLEEEAAKTEQLREHPDAPPNSGLLGGQSFFVKNNKRVLTKVEDEARRRLIRQATAANQAVVKGNCLMALQLLTGREALRTHYAWQLMMKTPMWMAFECRRELQGYDERQPGDEVLLNAIAATASGEEEESEREEECEEERSSHEDEKVGDAPLASELKTSATESRTDVVASPLVSPVAAVRQKRMRLQTDNFYNDYLHRCSDDSGPLASMSYYTYAMWVRVVEGSPYELAANEYAFDVRILSRSWAKRQGCCRV